jgi:biotin transport system substrate-specific component
MTTGTLVATLSSRVDHAVLIRAAATLFVTVLTAAAAQISVPMPFTPVPFTLQPMVVLLGGAALGARLGLTSQLLYLAAGAAGLPVFAASGILPQGAARLLGPTAGYLFAFPFAAFATGWLAERGFDRRYISSVAAMAAGLAIIFACGMLWLSFLAPQLGLRGAAAAGFIPFVPADILKVFVAAAVLPAAWRITRAGNYRT